MIDNSGEIIEFVDEIEKLQIQVAQKLGYKLVDHKLELYGSKNKKTIAKKNLIKTLGCQMNEYGNGYDLVKGLNYFPTNNIDEADCYALNTCHIEKKRLIRFIRSRKDEEKI